LGITDRVTFHGHAVESDLPEIYPTFDVLAVPSVPVPGWLEQFGRVVVEGQAAGVPSVASASGALPDVVGDAGLLVPPNDPGALCAALVRYLDEPGLWQKLRDEGIHTVERYSWASVADQQLDLYERVTALR
jgi:glycosyltransferase involved in cell wall biosynthesis